jgi:hypothetical protein
MKWLIQILITLLIFNIGYAQELECTLVVNSEQINLPDKSVFKEMQTSLSDFMNNTKFSNDDYKAFEKIKCNILITINSYEASTGKATGIAQVLSYRPVYGTDYETTMFNFLDKDWTFVYQPGQQLFYSEGNISSNLAGLLSFYAYVLIGIDYDSFADKGGQKMIEKAQNLVQVAQSLPDKGWKSFDGQQNRFWISENLMNQQLIPLREAYYKYHRLILDDFNKDQDKSRKEVITILEDLKKIEQIRPATQLMRIFFDSKSNELIKMLVAAPAEDKQKAYDLLRILDATNATKYQQQMVQGR